VEGEEDEEEKNNANIIKIFFVFSAIYP